MLRRAATRSAVLRTPSFAPSVGAVRSYNTVLESGGKLGEREKAVEERAIRSHDFELLRKLRESLGIQENQPIPDTVVSQVSSSPKINPFAQQSSSTTSSRSSSDEAVTREEFLEFRKEIVQRLRNLEDDIMDLQMRRK